ncbi:MAG: NADH-quinone oxidoreductase subunit L [Candidatus Sumerlaeia bacterium]|nr:NADH-quinone oxidoreductase subunit L [Candidatus Sumerlaeia bacterium]
MAMADYFIHLCIAIFLLPLTAFVVVALFHRRLPRHGDWIVISFMGVALILALVIFAGALNAAAHQQALRQHRSWEWLLLNFPKANSAETGVAGAAAPSALEGVSPAGAVRVGILLDGLTAVMLVVVTVVSFLVFLYSSAYLKGDVRYGRYYACLSLFATSMLGLVLSDNLLTLYIFWELVGFCSYLLIGHWFERKSAADAAIKAFITTRIGDVGMLIGILLIYSSVGSFRYEDIFRYVQEGGMSDSVSILGLEGSLRFWAAVGLFFGAMGKSAQFPLHVWLPDAMEGPTPVSALIHAATMVAAGVYLVGRMHPFFPPEALLFVAYIGAITAALSATIALVMDDIKKVLAYSTISQLGYMMLGLGVGGEVGGVAAGFLFGLFHLTTHAFFKAGLFLGSGSVIHAAHHEQSMWQYGGLARKLPVTFATFLIFTLSLCGFPYLTSGFFTKDGIIGAALQFGMQHPSHRILGWTALGAAGLTSFYMFRLIFLTFFGRPRNEHLYHHAHESPWAMVLPLLVLAVLSLGFVGSNRTFGLLHEDSWFSTLVKRPSLVAHPAESALPAESAAAAHGMEPVAAEHGAGHTADSIHLLPEAHHQALVGSITVFLAGLIGAALVYYFQWIRADAIARIFRPVYVLLLNKWYMDHLYRACVILPYLVFCYFIRLVDTYVIDAVVNFWGWAGRAGAWLVGRMDLEIVDGAVNGTAWSTGFAGRILRLTQTGQVRNYILILVAGATALLLLFWKI